VGEKRDSCIILVGSSKRGMSFGISGHRYKENVSEKQNLRMWAAFLQLMIRVVVNIMMNIHIPWNSEDFLTS
jgi:hypothetical protein